MLIPPFAASFKILLYITPTVNKEATLPLYPPPLDKGGGRI
jgi:hypothetical protein